MIIKLIIDLQVEELVNLCLKNLQSIEDKNLKKLAVFSILKLGEESLLLELKALMKKDEDLAKVVLDLINSLNRNEWKFFY
jgi:HEAT repeat protein